MEQSTGNCNAIRQLAKDKPIFSTLFRGSENVQEVVTIASIILMAKLQITCNPNYDGFGFLLLTLAVKLGVNSISPEHRLLLGTVSFGRSRRGENTDCTQRKKQF